MRTPRCCSAATVLRDRTESTRALSVISTMRASGGKPLVCSSRSIVLTRSRSSRFVVERFTATVSGMPWSRQDRICSRATLIVRLATLRISPARSAAGRNSSGSSNPRVGCCQRSSASTLCTLPSLRVDLGLVVHRQLVAVRTARRAVPRRGWDRCRDTSQKPSRTPRSCLRRIWRAGSPSRRDSAIPADDRSGRDRAR